MNTFGIEFSEPLNFLDAMGLYPDLMKPYEKNLNQKLFILSSNILKKNLEESKEIKDFGDKDFELVKDLNIIFINNIEKENFTDYKRLKKFREKGLNIKRKILQKENIILNPHEFRIIQNKKDEILDNFLVKSLKNKKYKNITYESIKDFINLFDISFLLTNELFVLKFFVLAGIAFPIAFMISIISIIVIYKKNKK